MSRLPSRSIPYFLVLFHHALWLLQTIWIQRGSITILFILPCHDSLANNHTLCTIGMLQYAGKEALAWRLMRPLRSLNLTARSGICLPRQLTIMESSFDTSSGFWKRSFLFPRLKMWSRPTSSAFCRWSLSGTDRSEGCLSDNSGRAIPLSGNQTWEPGGESDSVSPWRRKSRRAEAGGGLRQSLRKTGWDADFSLLLQEIEHHWSEGLTAMPF